MKTLLLSTATALLVAQPAYAANDKFESSQMFASGIDGNVMVGVNMADNTSPSVQSSQAGVSVFVDNVLVLSCFGTTFPNGGDLDLVHAQGSGKGGTADASPLLDDMECGIDVNGTGLESLSMSCEWDGEFFTQTIGNTKQIVNGEQQQFHARTTYATNECEVEVNGETYFADSGDTLLSKGM